MRKAIQKFGRPKTIRIEMNEMDWMHQQSAFVPMDPSKLTPTKKKEAMKSLTFPSEKRSGETKAQTKQITQCPQFI